MGGEKKRRGVTPRSPEGRRMVPEGVFESALIIFKKAFPEETMGVGDTDFWIEIEKKSSGLTPAQVCFQYHMIDVDPAKLAELCMRSFPAYRTGIQMSNIDKEQQHDLITRATYIFLPHYPEKYREQYE